MIFLPVWSRLLLYKMMMIENKRSIKDVLSFYGHRFNIKNRGILFFK